jgi:hypothetical protein
MMKKIFTGAVAVLVTMACLKANAQKTDIAEYERNDRKVELLLDTAARHMILFVLSRNEAEYNTSMNNIAEAEKLNAELEKKVDVLTGNALTIEKQELEDRKEEIGSYKDQNLKTDIMNESDKERTIQVKFKGKAYNVGKLSKAKYDLFSTYLPRN